MTADQIDVYSVAGLAVVVLALVEVLKRTFSRINGCEDLTAIVLGVVIGLAMRFTGEAFVEGGPIGTALQIIAAIIFAQIAHDKLLTPTKDALKSK